MLIQKLHFSLLLFSLHYYKNSKRLVSLPYLFLGQV
ncbi:MAG TPA: hypothetical protein [Caudoviricetes sp.]|nr:MAG TPA: hypothetical protein [Caudoviricetes sp.]